MSVVILGMEIPHDCPHCEFAAIGYASPMSSDCTLYCRAVDKFKDCATAVLKDKPYEVISHYNDRPDWCPLRPLPEKRRWIPVEEKLPEGVHSVLVRRKDGGIFLWEYSPYSPTDDIWVDEYSNVFSVYDTTHWMELPEFPEEDKR